MTCGSDKLVKLWNPHKGKVLKTYSGHGYEVLDVSAASDNGRLVSCGVDKTVIFWDVATGNVIRRFRGHTQVYMPLVSVPYPTPISFIAFYQISFPLSNQIFIKFPY